MIYVKVGKGWERAIKSLKFQTGFCLLFDKKPDFYLILQRNNLNNRYKIFCLFLRRKKETT